MGAERRRRVAGTYPTAGPASDFRAPRGTVCLTIDVAGVAPSTVVVDAGQVVDICAASERIAAAAGLPYEKIVSGLAAEFARLRRTGGDASGIALSILWTALHHPRFGTTMRDAVSRSLRLRDRAHLTWRISEAGLLLALADGFVEMDEDEAAAIMPSTPVSVVLVGDGEPPLH